MDFRRIKFTLSAPRDQDLGFLRSVERFPFVPSDETRLSELCYEAFNIQAHGLEQRLRATQISKVVIGVSGGLDSTHALLVAIAAMERLGLPRENILGYTLPAFATTSKTKSNAWGLMRALGITGHEIDLSRASLQMLRDIQHPAADGEERYDATYENVGRCAKRAFVPFGKFK